jgi:hypothetical protein
LLIPPSEHRLVFLIAFHVLIQLEELGSSSLSFSTSHHNNNHIYFITINITTFIFIISSASLCGIALPPRRWLQK